MEKMKAHREPRPSVIVQCYQFNSCQCATSETVTEYVAALLKLAEHCNFGETLDEMLQDRLVLVSCGQTTISVQGVYCLQYKRPCRKGSGRFDSADLVFTLSNMSTFNFLIILCA